MNYVLTTNRSASMHVESCIDKLILTNHSGINDEVCYDKQRGNKIYW